MARIKCRNVKTQKITRIDISIGSPAKAEATIYVPVIRVVYKEMANLQVARVAIPTAAPNNPIRSTFCKTPFPDIAAHVIQPQDIRTA